MAEGPLSQEDLLSIKDALRALDDADRDARLAIQAGIDVQAQVDQIREQRARLLKIKQTYFPGQ